MCRIQLLAGSEKNDGATRRRFYAVCEKQEGDIFCPPPVRELKGLSHLVQSCLSYRSCMSKVSARSTGHVGH